MYHVLVLKATNYVRYCLALTDVAKELVPQPFSPARPSYKPSDVHEIDGRRHDTLALCDLRQRIQPLVRYHRDPKVRDYSGERVILSLSPRPRKAVEHRRFADVWQSDYSYLHTV